MLNALANATHCEDDRDDILLRINLRLSGGEVADVQIAQLGAKEETKPTPKDLMFRGPSGSDRDGVCSHKSSLHGDPAQLNHGGA